MYCNICGETLAIAFLYDIEPPSCEECAQRI